MVTDEAVAAVTEAVIRASLRYHGNPLADAPTAEMLRLAPAGKVYASDVEHFVRIGLEAFAKLAQGLR